MASYYSLMFASRAVPLGIVFGLSAARGKIGPDLLTVMVVSQALDSVLGAAFRSPGQTISAGLAATLLGLKLADQSFSYNEVGCGKT
ncbi:hypothetical protein [Corynebacterium kalinowskii]|uniref:hypothetical protein n=1 Tax=Corynebacterium kalinowskii TaxID=2675216 RepID=UPI0012E30283|nr:hypothetical protein [Corynebacterium kalinowskii]